MTPPYFRVRLRNNQNAVARALTEQESCPPFGLVGFRWHPEAAFSIGDPELWRVTGQWREDAEPHRFDIIEAGGVVSKLEPPVPQQDFPHQADKPTNEQITKLLHSLFHGT